MAVIELPVRYDENTGMILDAQGRPLAWCEGLHKCAEAADEIGFAIAHILNSKGCGHVPLTDGEKSRYSLVGNFYRDGGRNDR